MFAQIVKAEIGDRLTGKADLREKLKRILESFRIGHNINKNWFFHLKSLLHNL